MTKQESIQRLSETMGVKKSEAEAFYNAFETQVFEAMENKEEVPFLGKFKTVPVKAKPTRKATNPKDPHGAKIDVPAKEATTKVKYVPSKRVKEMFA